MYLVLIHLFLPCLSLWPYILLPAQSWSVPVFLCDSLSSTFSLFPQFCLPGSPCGFSPSQAVPPNISLLFSDSLSSFFSLPSILFLSPSSCAISAHSPLSSSLFVPHKRPQLLGGSVKSATPSPKCCPKYITYLGPLAQGCRNTNSSGTRSGASSSGYPSWLRKESLTLPQEGPWQRSDGVRSIGESVPTGCWP